MRKFLLDTHVFLWWLTDDSRLGVKCREVIADSRNEIYVSAASGWEIAIKKKLGKLKAPDDLEHVIEDEGFDALSIDFFHAQLTEGLPPIHQDSFDRILIAQAQAEGMILITGDRNIAQYSVRLMDAGG